MKTAELLNEVSLLRAEVRELKAMVTAGAPPEEPTVDCLYFRRLAEALARGDKGPLREHNRRVKASRKARAA